MVNRFFSKFSLQHEKEETAAIVDNIAKGVVFRGTNLWILIFAIFIASLGLNVNSTAVIIGAMLISPLMGPIMGLGLSVGINDLALLRKSFYNYSIATGVALATSTVFFLLSPLNEAHSEILARTSPNIYDVLIALFGGLAGIIATASKQKGNVITGVAIATALMPPLCTAGYGLATFKLDFFIGAFYLFIINTVFIALATFLTTRFLKFPYKHLPDVKANRNAKRIIWAVVIITLVPSLYFGYDIVQQNKFVAAANRFIATECNFKNDYLLNKKIDAKNKTITLVYGGDLIAASDITALKNRLPDFNLSAAQLGIHQGFSYLAAENKTGETNEQTEELNEVIREKNEQLRSMQNKRDSIKNFSLLGRQVFKELKVQYPDLKEAIINPGDLLKNDTTAESVLLVLLDFSRQKRVAEKNKIEKWLKVRFNRENIKVIF